MSCSSGLHGCAPLGEPRAFVFMQASATNTHPECPGWASPRVSHLPRLWLTLIPHPCPSPGCLARVSEGPWALPETGSNSQGLVVFSQAREKARSQGSREWALSVALRDSPSLWLNVIFLFSLSTSGCQAPSNILNC